MTVDTILPNLPSLLYVGGKSTMIYLDTSSIRKIANKLNDIESSKIFTSSLAVFELLSGINENDFILRKSIVENLLDSSIHIDWDTYKEKINKAFQQSFDDIEGYVIKSLAQKLISCSCLDEYRNIKIYTDSDTYYTHESLSDFDNELSKTGKVFSYLGKNEWRNYEKTVRKQFKKQMLEENMISSYIQKLTEFSLISLAEDLSGCKRPGDKYFEVIEKYDHSLDVHLRYNNLLFLLLEMNGSICGKNDTVDMLHLIYLKKNDVIISEDNIFKRLNKYINHLQVYQSNQIENVEK